MCDLTGTCGLKTCISNLGPSNHSARLKTPPQTRTGLCAIYTPLPASPHSPNHESPSFFFSFLPSFFLSPSLLPGNHDTSARSASEIHNQKKGALKLSPLLSSCTLSRCNYSNSDTRLDSEWGPQLALMGYRSAFFFSNPAAPNPAEVRPSVSTRVGTSSCSNF